ncbi:MAG: ATP-dependent DNA helicase [Deltaproteobacteria bacterium]|nr:ATP-dependent DNA helicase [Deltaproteobacteria bacterium]MBN2671459.1 ATP-dependent DNA helicase [Deltaproteobacteria bacterium]
MITVQKTFSNDGPIAQKLGRYEQRNSQVQLAQAVEKVMEMGGVLLGEAGTGTGKTLAYLVPAILNGNKIVVSTGTKNLQEQIFFRDLEFLKDALQLNVRTAYLKGQDNYLCKTRLHAFVHSPKCLSFPSQEVARLTQWANITATGDRMEQENMADDAPIWREVCSTRETRIGARCPFFDECFVTRARREAMLADIVVVNHHLYFADLATRMQGGAILPNHETVIFDEAHLIEDIATEFFSTKVSSLRTELAVGDAMAAVNAAALRDDAYESQRAKTAKTIISLCANLFDLFRGPKGRTNLESSHIDTAHKTYYHKLDSALESFELSLKHLEGQDESIDHCAHRIQGVRDDLGEILEHNDHRYVYWADTRNRSVILGASPIDVSAYFRNEVLFKRESVVFCSATLSTGGNFDFFKSRLGIDFEVEELLLDAPFQYEQQARLYIPNHPTDPRSDEFVHMACSEINQLISLTDGGALVLCTSFKNMNAIHEKISENWFGPVLKQGDAPKFSLIEQFVNTPSSVLIATTSFWQGVDIPGDDLRLVIIDKLPFASPSDPITAARVTHLNDQHKNAFMEYQVPQAAITLKQGFGRLIRTAFDRGIVAILDNRLHTKRYASSFIRSLPPAPVLNDFNRLKQWWNDVS